MIRIGWGAAMLFSLLAGCAHTPPTSRSLGAPVALGSGTVAGYADFDAAGDVQAIGVVFSSGALDGLPAAPSDGHHCFDANKDGAIDLDHECSGGHERVLPLPQRRQPARGHAVQVGAVELESARPHPARHLRQAALRRSLRHRTDRERLRDRAGACGPERVRCDQFARGAGGRCRRTTCTPISRTWKPWRRQWAIT